MCRVALIAYCLVFLSIHVVIMTICSENLLFGEINLGDKIPQIQSIISQYHLSSYQRKLEESSLGFERIMETDIG